MLMYMEFWSLVYKIRLNDNMVICVRHVLIDCFYRHILLDVNVCEHQTFSVFIYASHLKTFIFWLLL